MDHLVAATALKITSNVCSSTLRNYALDFLRRARDESGKARIHSPSPVVCFLESGKCSQSSLWLCGSLRSGGFTTWILEHEFEAKVYLFLAL